MQEIHLEQQLLLNPIIQQGKYSRRKIFKIFLVLVIFISFLIYRLLYVYSQPQCIYDAYQIFTLPLNQDLAKKGLNVFIGIGQVLMDGWLLFFLAFWAIKIKTTRLPMAGGIFFAIRTIFLYIEKFPFPEHIQWHSPGFFSFTVPYDHTSDFFYSGHTGTFTLLFWQFHTLKSGLGMVLMTISLIYMMNMLIVVQVHYTIDVIGGLIFASWVHHTVKTYCKYMDMLASLPFQLGKFVYQKTCKPIRESIKYSQLELSSNELEKQPQKV